MVEFQVSTRNPILHQDLQCPISREQKNLEAFYHEVSHSCVGILAMAEKSKFFEAMKEKGMDFLILAMNLLTFRSS